VLISIDTLRADRLSSYGWDKPTSPRIDRLASNGLLFERAYSHSPKTAESHMSLMTGLYPEAHRVQNFVKDTTPLSGDVPTIAAVLEKSGYRTAAFTDGGNVTGRLGFDRGFDAYEEFAPLEPGLNSLMAAGEAIERFARDSDDESPFFVFVHTFEVHDPYVPPRRYLEGFVDPGYEKMAPLTPDQMTSIWESGEDPGDAFWKTVDITNEEHVHYLDQLYQAGIRYTDDGLGDLLDTLDRNDLTAKTLVILLSDHGEEFLDHGYVRHERLYDELLHVPLIVRFPTADDRAPSPGTRVGEIVRLIDVMPTILDYLGLPAPGHLQGRSLLPIMEGQLESPRVVWSQWFQSGESALRVGSWKLHRRKPLAPLIRVGPYSFFWDRRPVQELYELASDPGEHVDLSDAEEEVRLEMNRIADRFGEQSDRLRRRFKEGAKVKLDDETKRQLEALGYL
jgi:arylsulfatase A-like enzyme